MKINIKFSPLNSSNIGTQTSSVAPGKTVDSKITVSPLCNTLQQFLLQPSEAISPVD